MALLRQVYGEDPADALQPPVEDEPDVQDPDVQAEYRALQEAKALMDRRPAVRPEPETLAAIYAAAEVHGRPTSGRPDRTPMAPASRHRWWRATTLAVTAVTMLGLGYWIGRTDASGPEPTASASASATADAGIPTWDDQEDLRVIQWRVKSLEDNLQGARWDQAVPLGAMQANEPWSAPPPGTGVERLDAGVQRQPGQR